MINTFKFVAAIFSLIGLLSSPSALAGYVQNDPLNNTDPTGRDTTNCSSGDTVSCTITRDNDPNNYVYLDGSQLNIDVGGAGKSHQEVAEFVFGSLIESGLDGGVESVYVDSYFMSREDAGFSLLAADVLTLGRARMATNTARKARSAGRDPMKKGVRPNQVQNKQARAARQQAERNTGKKFDRDTQRQFHDRITGEEMTYDELVQEAEAVLNKQ